VSWVSNVRTSATAEFESNRILGDGNVAWRSNALGTGTLSPNPTDDFWPLRLLAGSRASVLWTATRNGALRRMPMSLFNCV